MIDIQVITSRFDGRQQHALTRFVATPDPLKSYVVPCYYGFEDHNRPLFTSVQWDLGSMMFACLPHPVYELMIENVARTFSLCFNILIAIVVNFSLSVQVFFEILLYLPSLVFFIVIGAGK